MMSSIEANFHQVQERIQRAAERSGRGSDEVQLIAVSKTQPVELIREAIAAGVEFLGENRVQEAASKVPDVPDSVSWHLVGHLQRNKVKQALDLFDLIHSVDSLRLGREIGARSEASGRTTSVLIQVNTSGADSQHGVNPDEVLDLAGQLSEMKGLQIEGLMTIGDFLPDPEQVRPCFRQLRNISESVRGASLPGVSMEELSMGMTGDFETAIEEGSTMVRVGTAIFGARQN